MHKILSAVFLVILLSSCKCFRDHCSSSGSYDKNYNDCRERLRKEGVLTDKDGRILVLDRTFFGYDRHDLTSDSRKVLKNQAAWMMANPTTSIVITGHCDERGTREYNIGLGERRATSARNYLITRGISSERITVVSKGKDDPIVEGSSERAWAQNRVSIISPS
ncbi:OmpA family protein [Alphaproteobacteria bacterium]|nr:OmpA family protein [Alphaproteobacteria bacterium]